MARLPQPGGDKGNWGDILNGYLSTSLKDDGTLKADTVGILQLASGAVTNTKLADGAVEEIKLSSAVQAKLNTSTDYLTLLSAAKNPDLLVVGAVTGDPVTSASVVWPNGQPGTLTITARHFTGAVNAYTITYGSPITKTFTQPTITRTDSGVATNIPQIVVTP